MFRSKPTVYKCIHRCTDELDKMLDLSLRKTHPCYFWMCYVGSWTMGLLKPYGVSSPVRAQGVKSRMCPPYPLRDRKRRLIGAVCRNHRIKRLVLCRCLDGHVKEPCEMSMALGARPWVQQLLLQSACTSMCRHMYD